MIATVFNGPYSPAHLQAGASNPDILLRISAVTNLVGLSRATIYNRMARGEFPEPLRLGLRCSRWRAGDLQEWVQDLKERQA